MSFKVGTKVQWKWLGRIIDGVVEETYTQPVSRIIKGKAIKRNGSEENPAYLVKSSAGNLALKLKTELQVASKNDIMSKKVKPTLFGED